MGHFAYAHHPDCVCAQRHSHKQRLIYQLNLSATHHPYHHVVQSHRRPRLYRICAIRAMKSRQSPRISLGSTLYVLAAFNGGFLPTISVRLLLVLAFSSNLRCALRFNGVVRRCRRARLFGRLANPLFSILSLFSCLSSVLPLPRKRTNHILLVSLKILPRSGVQVQLRRSISAEL